MTDLREEVGNPILYAIIVGVAMASLMAIVSMIVMVPIASYYKIGVVATGAVVLSLSLFAFVFFGMLALLSSYQTKLEECRQQVDAYMVRAIKKTEALPEEDEQDHAEEDVASDLIKIFGTPKTVRITDGLTIELLVQLSRAQQDGLDVVSQRTLDSAGIITRDPNIEPNAKTLMEWLIRNEFVEHIGNSRHQFTPIGEKMLDSAFNKWKGTLRK